MINAPCGEQMAKTIRIGRELFESILSKMVDAKPLYMARIAKSKKNPLRTTKKAA
jgi:hypothetical protein